MRSLITIAVLTVAFFPSKAHALISWQDDLESAMRLAKQTNRLVLVHFWSDDCPPCRRVEKDVFPRSDVARAMDSGYVAVKIHGKQMRHLTEKFNVRGWPTDIILTPEGKELYRTWSPKEPQAYIRLLDTVAAYARVNLPTNNIAQQPAAQTPQSMTAPSQRPTKQFTSSGIGTPEPAGQSSGQSPPPTRVASYGGNRFTGPPSQGPPAPQGQPANQADPRQPPVRAQVRSNPFVQGPAATVAQAPNARPNDRSPAAADSAPQPSRYGSPGQTAPDARGDTPETRYGARNPRRASVVDNRAAAPQQPAATRYNPGGIIPPTRQQPNSSPTANRYGAVAPSRTNPPRSNAPAAGQPPQNRYGSANVAPNAGRGPAPQVAPVTRQGANVALDGFCPVTLQQKKTWVKGNPNFAVVNRNKVYHCSGAAEAAAFRSNPDFYSPLLSGYDPVKLIHENRLVDGKREFGMWHDEQMLLFADEASLKAFWQAPQRYMPTIRQAMAPRGGNQRRLR